MDWSINLPSWAYHLGYRLEGRRGTYDDLELYKDKKIVRMFEWYEVPDIFEIEEIIREMECST